MGNEVFQHLSVLSRETLEAMEPRSGGVYLDMTLGGAGHASLILENSGPDGKLFGIDRDSDAIKAAQERLEPFDGRFEIRHGPFAEVTDWLEEGSCDGVLMDLGISSPQVDWGHRGFSFLKAGNLDMRMNVEDQVTAAEVVNTWSESELIRIFRIYGEEPRARKVAQAIAASRAVKPFETTLQLAECIESALGRRGDKHHPATRVFQALRMQVNDELGQLEQGLVAAWNVLKEQGKLVTISFHSLEARMVKQFGSFWSRDYRPGDAMDTPALRVPKEPCAKWPSRKAVKPSVDEIKSNPRARSAQLRTLIKLRALPAGEEMDWRTEKRFRR